MKTHSPLEIPPQKVAVLGAGAWGVVLAAHLARQGHSVTAWDLVPGVIERMRAQRSHPSLPGFALPESVRLTADLDEAMDFSKNPAPGAISKKGTGRARKPSGPARGPAGPRGGPDCVVVVVPSHGVRALAERFRPPAPAGRGEGSDESDGSDRSDRSDGSDGSEGAEGSEEREGRIPAPAGAVAGPPWVLCAKGIEEETLLSMTGVVESVWGTEHRDRLAVLSGPSFAAEVALGRPATVCAASPNAALGRYVQALFMTDRFRVYTQDDVLGVELGGALKNVIAIAAGVCDGMGLGDNARAALITRGLAEMIRLGTALGARAETFAGLAGMGDLILTCCGRLSRNHRFGELLARGSSAKEALEEIGMVVEGMRTARSARQLAERHGVEMPIVREVYAVLYENKSPEAALHDLMGRGARPERD